MYPEFRKRENKVKKKVVSIGIVLVMLILLIGVSFMETNMEKVAKDFTVSYEGIETADWSVKASVHDPSVIKANGRYYIFGSHMTAAVSDDLRQFASVAKGYNAKNKIYGDFYTEGNTAFDYAGRKSSLNPTDDRKDHVWAPDVIYNEAMGKYVMYTCASSTWNTSNLCFLTADDIEGPYTYQGALIYSGLTGDNIEATDVLDYVDEAYAKKHYYPGTEYNFTEYPNAIDPAVFYDADGRMWMVYGSWSGGIFLLEIDEQTGKVIHPAASEDDTDIYFGKRLMGGGHKSIEGPYIQYDEESGYYYLFVSYGALQNKGGYQIRVFRSKTVDGDYVDMNGAHPSLFDQDHSKYGLKLSGNYILPGLKTGYMATGHNSSMIDEDGKKYIVYHTRFQNRGESHSPRVKQYFLNKEGWPCMLPYCTDGETILATGYAPEKVTGMYYMIDQGTAINDNVAEPVMIQLTEKGNIYTAEGLSGTWTMEEGTFYMNVTLGENTYSGVFCEMNDEAGTPVMTFSAVGNNESIWGVKYE